LHREVEGQDKMTLKNLTLKPMSCYADSLAGKLDTWRRWETWAMSQSHEAGGSAFKPSDFLASNYFI
jgi:hypothetical protein